MNSEFPVRRYAGTCWRFDLKPYFPEPACDAFLVVLEEPKDDEVRCLIIGFDSDTWEAHPGHTVEVRFSHLRPMF